MLCGFWGTLIYRWDKLPDFAGQSTRIASFRFRGFTHIPLGTSSLGVSLLVYRRHCLIKLGQAPPISRGSLPALQVSDFRGFTHIPLGTSSLGVSLLVYRRHCLTKRGQPPFSLQKTPPHQAGTGSYPIRDILFRSVPFSLQKTPPHQAGTGSYPIRDILFRSVPFSLQKTPPHQAGTGSYPIRDILFRSVPFSLQKTLPHQAGQSTRITSFRFRGFTHIPLGTSSLGVSLLVYRRHCLTKRGQPPFSLQKTPPHQAGTG